MSITTTFDSLIVADLDANAPAKRIRRVHEIAVPVDLRTVVSRDEIRAADARHNQRVRAAYIEAHVAAWELFETRQTTIDEYRETVRALVADRDRRLVRYPAG